jgi:glycosyltransferase involved in cell wall biosynthesis
MLSRDDIVMTSITALLHTKDDALRLGRALETLYACDDILVVDHGSRDATVRVARAYGARIVDDRPGAALGDYLRLTPNPANPGWLLCLDPHESLSEKLAASLFEWKSDSFHVEGPTASAFSVFLREETAEGWLEVPAAQTRLVPQTWNLWKGTFPVHEPSAVALQGELLRFIFP